jgi:antitoxin (DNA-binding transcriptional repressor) of toxin-antitoxin stability system
MTDATVEQIQSHLPEILLQLKNGGEVTILSEGKPVGRLLQPLMPKGVPIPGRGAGMVIRMIDDDDHLKDFEEYMP